MKRALSNRLPDIAAWLALAVATLIVCWPLGLTNRILAGRRRLHLLHALLGAPDGGVPRGPGPALEPVPLLRGAVPREHPGGSALSPALAPQLAEHRAGARVVRAAARMAGRRLHVHAGDAIASHEPARGTRRRTDLRLSGFTLARVENINQLNALAWLPAMLWLYDETLPRGTRRTRLRGRAKLAFRNLVHRSLTIVIALQLLAGHTQTTFINMVGLGLWAVLSLGWPLRRRNLARLLPLLAVLPALALSAAQLLPTIELNGLGLRTGGLRLPDRCELLAPAATPGAKLPATVPRGLGRGVRQRRVRRVHGVCGCRGPDAGGARPRGSLASGTGACEGCGPALRAAGLALAGVLLALGAYNPLYYLLWRWRGRGAARRERTARRGGGLSCLDTACDPG